MTIWVRTLLGWACARSRPAGHIKSIWPQSLPDFCTWEQNAAMFGRTWFGVRQRWRAATQKYVSILPGLVQATEPEEHVKRRKQQDLEKKRVHRFMKSLDAPSSRCGAARPHHPFSMHDDHSGPWAQFGNLAKCTSSRVCICHLFSRAVCANAKSSVLDRVVGYSFLVCKTKPLLQRPPELANLRKALASDKPCMISHGWIFVCQDWQKHDDSVQLSTAIMCIRFGARWQPLYEFHIFYLSNLTEHYSYLDFSRRLCAAQGSHKDSVQVPTCVVLTRI
jgi:hypothetical protein